MVFQLIDMRHAPSKDDLQMLDFLIDNEIPFVVVFTKADKLRATQRKERMAGFAKEIPCFEDITFVEFSAVTGEGVERIREIIEDVAQDAAEQQQELESDCDPQEEPPQSDPVRTSPFGAFLTPNKNLEKGHK